MSGQWTGIQYQRVLISEGEEEDSEEAHKQPNQDLDNSELKPPKQFSDKDDTTPLDAIVEISSFLLDPLDKSDLAYDPQNGPPPLRYPIHTKKWFIISACALFILLNTILPTIIFYVLRHGA